MLMPQELLTALVATPSFSGDEDAVVELLATRFTRAGFTVQRFGKNLVVDVVGEPGPMLMFASHVDTVPAGQAWTQDPFSGHWENDRLVGLGANDAGASVVAMCAAVDYMAQLKFAGTLRLALVVEEETSNAGMAQVLGSVGMPDMAVIGEPTGLQVVRIQAGLAILQATWHGLSCHAAHAGKVKNRNALLSACRELAQLPECQSFEAGPGLAPTTLVPAILQAGDRHNRVPVHAVATFDVRLTPPHSAQQISAWLQTQLPTADVEIKSDRLHPIETGANHRLVVAALKAANREEAIASNTMSDMALLQGVPAIKCGPGETSRSHTPDEFITSAELLQGVAFYSQLASQLLQGES